MQILVEHCIKENKVSELLNELIELNKFKNVLKDVTPRYIRSIHNNLVWAFIEKINGILIFNDYILNYDGEIFSITKINEVPQYVNKAKDYNKIVTSFCKKIKKEGLLTKYGTIVEVTENGNCGGNGRVLFGKLNHRDVAIKILYNNSRDKQNRFFDEFINVFMSLQKENGIVELYLYDSVKVEGQEIYYIIMKKYIDCLKSSEGNVKEQDVVKLFIELCNIILKVHNVNIVHRDIKPENILMDENDLIVLSDFGIAYFDPEHYDYTGHTKSNDLLGNRKFSAPEQGDKGVISHPTMDIFALGQIMQWYVTGKTHYGMGRKKFKDIIQSDTMKMLDNIIEKCICQEPQNRYQSVEEILDELKEHNISLDNYKVVKNETLNLYDNCSITESNGLGLGDKIEVI